MKSIEICDIVASWCQRQRKKFPTITKLAYIIHGIQVSSATSERSFSTKGRVIQDRRTSKTQLTTVVFLNSVHPKQTRKLEINPLMPNDR